MCPPLGILRRSAAEQHNTTREERAVRESFLVGALIRRASDEAPEGCYWAVRSIPRTRHRQNNTVIYY